MTCPAPRPGSFRHTVRDPEHGPAGADQSPSGPAVVRLVARIIPRARIAFRWADQMARNAPEAAR